MLYLPYEKYQIESTLSLDSIEGKLNQNVETNISAISYRYLGIKPFRGHIGKNYFKVWRIIKYRNSFLPVITGKLCPTETGSKIEVFLRLNYSVMIFWALWMLAAICFLIMFIFILAGVEKLFSLVPLFMIVFGYLLCMIPFNIESSKAKEILKEIVQP
jgi:hypothetical protein